MKNINLFKKLVIKKSILLLSIIFCFGITMLNAQSNPCNCVPTSTVLQYDYDFNDGSGNHILVEFTLVQCNPNIGIIFNKGTGFKENPLGLTPPPAFTGNLTTDYRAAQLAILAMYGGGASMTFTYPASCEAVAQVTYPSVTCFSFPLEGPSMGLAIPYTLGTLLQTVDCSGESCCKQDWVFNPNTNQYQLKPNYPVITCENSTPPLIGANYQMKCQDITGAWITYTGVLTAITGPCYSFCDPATLSTSFTTTNTKEFKQIPPQTDLKIAPIPATDHITFSEIKNIYKIEIYDINGKKVMEQSTFESSKIDISNLNKGILFVKVIFKDANMRTIKIIKE
jgi:hypothetical protein